MQTLMVSWRGHALVSPITGEDLGDGEQLRHEALRFVRPLDGQPAGLRLDSSMPRTAMISCNDLWSWSGFCTHALGDVMVLFAGNLGGRTYAA